MTAAVIGIVGSGNIGGVVARLATAAGLRVVLANSRGPASLDGVVAELGDTVAADTATGAIQRADIVVLALPFGAYASLPASALSGKVVVDATNYYPDRDGSAAALVAGDTTSSEVLACEWPEAQLVKGLNNVDFLRLSQLARPAGAADRTALPVAGDGVDAKSKVVEFLDAIGYDAIDLGGLAEGWRSQPNTPIYVTPYYRATEPPAEDPMERFITATAVPVRMAEARALAAAAES